MNAFQAYTLSIIATALICTAVSGLLQNSPAKGIVRTVYGMILTITVVAPLRKLEITLPREFGDSVLDAASAASAEGEALSQHAVRTIIKREAEAYIQDKAALLQADITAEVIISNEDPPIPEGAVISGNITPYAKQQLQDILWEQLQISKENLEWTG